MNALRTITVVFVCTQKLLRAEDIHLASAEYLHSAIRDLQEKSVEFVVPVNAKQFNNNPISYQSLKKPLHITAPVTNIDRSDNFDQGQLIHYLQGTNNHEHNSQGYDNEEYNNQQHNQAYTAVPSLTLTKGELLAIYDSAVQSGNNIVNADSNTAVHEVPNNYDSNVATSYQTVISHPTENKVNDNGYYYYYYPLKNLLEDINNTTTGYSQHLPQQDPYTVHSHTHLHNVKIEPPIPAMPLPLPYGPYGVAPPPKNKAMEPLFMAISSFMGMAMMFLFSMVFLPQFRNHKSRSDVKPEIATLSDIVFEAIEGHDCRERIYCEAGKVLNALNLGNNRFVKFFQRIMPVRFGRNIERIRQEAQKKRKCVLIQCKRKGNKKVKANAKTEVQQKNKKTPVQQKVNNRTKLKTPK